MLYRLRNKPPPFDYTKVNVDAIFAESSSASSVGMVARDSSGKVIISPWDFIRHCTSVEEAELRACLVGLCMGITIHNPIKTDCAFAAAALANEIFEDPLWLI